MRDPIPLEMHDDYIKEFVAEAEAKIEESITKTEAEVKRLADNLQEVSYTAAAANQALRRLRRELAESERLRKGRFWRNVWFPIICLVWAAAMAAFLLDARAVGVWPW